MQYYIKVLSDKKKLLFVKARYYLADREIYLHTIIMFLEIHDEQKFDLFQ